jgi:DNA repair protein RadC
MEVSDIILQKADSFRIFFSETMNQYITNFQWEAAKYPTRQQLRNITDNISKELSRIDADLKTKAQAYNQLKTNLATLERKSVCVFF